MFMGKTERTNIIRLLEQRMRDCRGIRTAVILLGLIFLLEAYMIVNMVTTYQINVGYMSLGGFSDLAIGLLVFIILYYTFQYEEYNEKHQIFPHTYTTHFVAFELYCYLIGIIVQVVALILYLLQYLLLFIITHSSDHVHLLSKYSIAYILTGFFVSIAYCFLFTALIILAATIIRKLRWWAIALYSAILIGLWLLRDQNILGTVINFYTNESSIILFFLKVILTILVAILLSHVINPAINNLKALKFNYAQLIIIIFLVISFLQSSLMVSRSNYSNTNEVSNIMTKAPSEYTDSEPAFVLDARSLEQGSKLHINYDVDPSYTCFVETATDNAINDQIKIYYSPAKDIRNSIDLTSYTNPRLEASLKGIQLTIRVILNENIKLIGIAPYNTPMQFTYFKDKSYYTDHLWSTVTSYTGSIRVLLPKNKKLIAETNNTSSQISQYID